MNKMRLRRAVLLGLAMSLTVGMAGFAEDIDHSLIITDTDIIYPADGRPTNEDYTITADEGHPTIELGKQGHDAVITTTGNITLNSGNGYAIAPGTSSSGTLVQDAQGSVVLNGNDIAINGSGILLDYANNNGYGDDEKAVYADINASGNFVIGKEGEGNTATTGLFVDTYAGTIEVDARKGILIDIEGDTLIGANESGHITVKANEDITLNATSSNTDIVMGYIENRNNQYSGYSINDSFILNGVNGIRNSEVTIQTEGNIYFNAQETNQNNLMNVGIFGVGSRKGNNGSPWPNPPVSEDNPETAPYLDEDGYVTSQDNITKISGNKLDFSVSNIYGIATGILAQGSNKVTIDLQSANGINFIAVSEQGDGAIGLDTADGNIKLTSTVGSNFIQGIAKDENAQGIGIQTENSDSPYTYSNRITLKSGLNNTVYGTSTAVYNTGSDSIVKAIADNGNNNLLSDKDVAVQAVDKSQTYLTANNGLNMVQTKNTEANAINADDSTVDLTGYQNAIVNGEYRVNTYGQGIAVLAANAADVRATATDLNDIQGAVQSTTKANVTITGDSNHIRSAAVVKDESDVDGVRTDYITAAAYTKDGGMISITGNTTGSGYQNVIATSVDTSSSNDENVMKERTVWAENGTISINGLTAIHASNGSIDDTNSVGIALVAGASRVEGNPEEETKPFSGVVNANLADGSYIYGDMLAGNGGLLNIYKGAGSEITTFSNEGQAIQDATIQGNALSGNGGELNLKLGANTYWTGRADDYQDADSDTWKNDHTNIFTPEFSNTVESSGSINIELDGAYWEVTGQSWVTSISGNDGTIDLINNDDPNGAQSHALHVGNLTGSHNFVVNLDKNHTISDMLYIHDVGTGEGDTNMYTQHVVINNIEGIEQIADGEKLRFATVLPGIDNLYFTGEYDGEMITNDETSASANRVMMRGRGVMNNAFLIKNEAYDQNDKENHEYNGGDSFTEVKPGDEYIDTNYENGTNWYLQRTKSADQASNAGKTIIDMSKVNYSNAIYMDRLNKRMGEARYIDGDEGLWVRMRHDRIGKSDAFRSKNTMFELGYDRKVGDREDGEHRQGVVFDYMRGTADYHNVAGEGDVRRGGVWFYDTWLGNKGHYTDYVLKFGRLSNDFDIYSELGEKITGDYSNFVYSASAEYGRKKSLGGDWYIEPQAQLQYAHVTDADYTTSQGTSVQLDAIDSLIGRVGFRLGKDVSDTSTFYIKADVLHEFLGDQDISAFDDTGRLDTTYENEGTWYDIGLGFSHQFSKGTYMFLDVEKTFGNDNEDTYQFNVGMNWKV